MKILVFSGAGLSAESGVPTFRDNNGLWTKYDLDKVCNYDTWRDNFDEVHEFYNMRKELNDKIPNLAHTKIADLFTKYEGYNFTQNIDKLLEKAGCNNVSHVHGDITKLRCDDCDHVSDLGFELYNGEPCNNCGSKYVKPHVVFFNEEAPEYFNVQVALRSLTANDAFIVIGSSGFVCNVDSYANNTRAGLKIVNNLEANEFISDDSFTHCFYEPATTAILKIEQLLADFSS